MHSTHPLQKLTAWIDANTNQVRFARAVGCSEPHLSLILSGKKRASLELVERIVRETAGAVTANDMLSEEARRTIDRACEVARP